MHHVIPSVLALHVPNLLPRSVFGFNLTWARKSGRLIWATLIYLAGLGIAYYLTTKPKRPEPRTWAQTVAGAVMVYAMMILGYGTVPHEWLQFGASYLNFGTDTFFLRKHQLFLNMPPFDVTRQDIVHIVVIGIYAFSLTANVMLFARWQKRPVMEPVEGEEGKPAGGWLRRRLSRTSAYGRPVTVNE